jgi:hypothetical protein
LPGQGGAAGPRRRHALYLPLQALQVQFLEHFLAFFAFFFATRITSVYP